jgi:hypothetical protein
VTLGLGVDAALESDTASVSAIFFLLALEWHWQWQWA